MPNWITTVVDRAASFCFLDVPRQYDVWISRVLKSGAKSRALISSNKVSNHLVCLRGWRHTCSPWSCIIGSKMFAISQLCLHLRIGHGEIMRWTGGYSSFKFYLSKLIMSSCCHASWEASNTNCSLITCKKEHDIIRSWRGRHGSRL